MNLGVVDRGKGENARQSHTNRNRVRVSGHPLPEKSPSCEDYDDMHSA